MSEFNRWGLSAGASLQNATGYFGEGQAPSTLNDGNRTVMAEARRDLQVRNAEVTATHSDGAYTLTYERELTAGELGGIYTFIADTANSTSSATLAINGNAAKPLVTPDGALAASAIDAKSIVTVAYDPSNDVYQVLNTVRQSGAEITELTGSDSFQVITSTGLRASIQTTNARAGAALAASSSFLVKLGSDQANIANNAFDTVEFDTVVVDKANEYDESSAFTFTPTTSGLYFLFATVATTTSLGDGDILGVRIFGSTSDETIYDNTRDGASGTRARSVAGLMNLTASETVIVQVFQNSGGVITLSSSSAAETCFGGFRVT